MSCDINNENVVYSDGLLDKVGTFPSVCSRNSGMIYHRIAEYRVFLGFDDKLPELHSFGSIQEAKNFLSGIKEDDYHFVHITLFNGI